MANVHTLKCQSDRFVTALIQILMLA